MDAGLVADGFEHAHLVLVLCDPESLQAHMYTVFAILPGEFLLVRAYTFGSRSTYVFSHQPFTVLPGQQGLKLFKTRGCSS